MATAVVAAGAALVALPSRAEPNLPPPRVPPGWSEWQLGGGVLAGCADVNGLYRLDAGPLLELFQLLRDPQQHDIHWQTARLIDEGSAGIAAEFHGLDATGQVQRVSARVMPSSCEGGWTIFTTHQTLAGNQPGETVESYTAMRIARNRDRDLVAERTARSTTSRVHGPMVAGAAAVQSSGGVAGVASSSQPRMTSAIAAAATWSRWTATDQETASVPLAHVPALRRLGHALPPGVEVMAYRAETPADMAVMLVDLRARHGMQRVLLSDRLARLGNARVVAEQPLADGSNKVTVRVTRPDAARSR